MRASEISEGSSGAAGVCMHVRVPPALDAYSLLG